ncbi:MAG: universal stress protein [Aestuariibacter sp.]|nr:universal stress protein [Aestuariibacter sp.]
MKRFKNILCVVNTDLKDHSALEQAVKLAENNQASITVVEVMNELFPDPNLLERALRLEEIQAKIVIEHREKLNELVAPWDKKIQINTKVLIGIPFLEIIYEVLRSRHDLVFKKAESGGLLNRVFGSDDMHLLRKCPCPVLLVKQKSPKSYQRILAAVDIDDRYPPEELSTRRLLNHQILELATSLALSESADLHIVHAWTVVGEGFLRGGFSARPEEEVVTYIEEVKQQHSQKLSILMSEIIDKSGRDALEYLKPEEHLLNGYPRKIIPELAGEIKSDLLVMGTVARISLPGFFMGNTAEDILSQLDCSVLTIKPQGFKTPVTLDE